MALGSITPRFFYSLSGGFQNQHQKGEHRLLRLAGSRQTNTTWQIGNSARLRVFSKGRVCAEAVKMSLSHTSFSFERIPAVVTCSFTSTSHPRRLPAGCRAQGAGGMFWTPAFGLLQEPEAIPSLPPHTQLGLKQSLNFSTGARKSCSTNTKDLLQFFFQNDPLLNCTDQMQYLS